ncbi:hypothetical protein QAD02_020597 [Eretmocerus hayati]|uniref:Uncharacterized protein n=1 Tax=Eretmocerus hayati TaxID=131215 RepID=A0ACC2PMI3_9HYME|nr:hypothetical protein QAD02_020597 [Eretmocerus hayati]
MSKIQCKVSPNRLCYVCGTLTFKGEIRDMTPSFMSLYHHYFKRDVRDQDKSYVPKGVCASCNTTLRAWSNGARKSMPFGSPIIWTRPSNHPEDCYFCNCLTEGYNRHNRKLIEYPDHTSSQRPRPHNSDSPIPPAPWIRREDDCEDRDSGSEHYMAKFTTQIILRDIQREKLPGNRDKTSSKSDPRNQPCRLPWETEETRS